MPGRGWPESVTEGAVLTVRRLGVGLVLPFAVVLVWTGCANRKQVLEIRGAVMYEKPLITSVSHVLTDRREEGGAAVVTVTMRGDPGLAASFDISQQIAARQPMTETGEGTYVGELSLPSAMFGGPYTITGRLEHEDAGEVVYRDPDPLTITLLDRAP
jgi:hypothetical protein